MRRDSSAKRPPRGDGVELAVVSEGCSVIRANQRPPGGSITGHRGILAPPRDEKLFVGMWVGVTNKLYRRRAPCVHVTDSNESAQNGGIRGKMCHFSNATLHKNMENFGLSSV